MAIQEVWLHGRGCGCIPFGCGESSPKDMFLVIFDDEEDDSAINVSPELNTIIKDQYGQRYIITPIPDME